MDFSGAKEYILKRLEKELNPDLVYHSIDHTMDVFNSAIIIAEKEQIESEDIDLIKAAALFHDAGMLNSYEEHEEASAALVREVLPKFGYSQNCIDVIAKSIITTKLPQNASTIIEKVLCDADLDYLGRDDFFMTSHKLRHEWITLGVNKLNLTEWYYLQIEFLSNHTYFTNCAYELRQEKKLKNLEEIKELLKLA